MAVYVQPQIQRGHYKAFKRLMPEDSNLPDNYDEWLKSQAGERSKIIKSGSSVKEIEVDPEEFVRYCRMSKTNSDSSALGSFTAAKAMKQKY